MKSILLSLTLLIAFIPFGFSQDSLLDELNETSEPVTVYAVGTFKGTRIINGHSIETLGKNELQYIISHRFGRVTDGWRNLFGLDNANIHFGLEYGITNHLMIGFGRSSYDKIYDGYAKYTFLQQSKGAKKMPLSLAAQASISVTSKQWDDANRKNYFSSRLYYSYQVLIARKFGDWFSLQLTPTMVHRNLVASAKDKNDVYAIGLGGSLRLTHSIRLNAEYFYLIPGQIYSTLNGEKVRNTLSIGVDIETGGHVFQLQFTNSRGMIEKHFITETTGNWLKGDIHFGFNITRVFDLSRKKPKKKDRIIVD